MTDPQSAPRSREEARAAKAQVAETLSAIEGVVGVGLERMPDGGWSLRVNVATEEVAQAVRERLPTGQQVVPAGIRVTGTIRAVPGDERE